MDEVSLLQRWRSRASQRAQRIQDALAPHRLYRWIAAALLALLYAACIVRSLRDAYTNYITVNLTMFILFRTFDFLSPQHESEDPVLPVTRSDDEFQPFVRRLPEFKFWSWTVLAICIALFLSLLPLFPRVETDVDDAVNVVLWAIWAFWAFAIVSSLIQKMIKHRYVPFSFGKKVHISPV